MDRSGYARIRDAPPAPLSRVHTGYPREKHQKVECAPAQVDQCIPTTPLRRSYDYQKFEVPAATNLGLTQISEAVVEYKNPFLDLYPDSPLNPRSINFSPEKWANNLHGFMAQDPMRYPRRNAGFSFENLNVYSFSRPTDYQKDVANVVLELGAFFRWLVGSGAQKVQILKGFDGLVEQGETLLIIGRPGAGCSTLLKAISGDIDGLVIDSDSAINYQGVSHKEMHSRFRGEIIRFAEMDTHFASLTVGETLLFAARARAPCDYTFPAVTRDVYAEQMKDVVMTTLGLCHLEDVAVGKITSAREKRRVSIAEAALGGHQLQCWDNSTRGLENTHVLNFCKMVQLSTAFGKTTACVALNKTPETVYKMFDKVTLLYEGRQIYFGPCDEARSFFTDLGFICEQRQTIADFLMSLTNPDERLIKTGYEFRVPRTPDEFAMVWRTSHQYSMLIQEVEEYDNEHPCDSTDDIDLPAVRRPQQVKRLSKKSPYTLSPARQIGLCIVRGLKRMRGDASFNISTLVVSSLVSMIVSIIFYDLPNDTSSMYNRSTLLFFLILLNALTSSLEIFQLFNQRQTVEKHARYAFVHTFAEAVSSIVCDLPYKLLNCVFFNTSLYFMTNLRRSLPAFFIFLGFSLLTTTVLFMFFRFIGAASRSLTQALYPTAIAILVYITYAGFVIPVGNTTFWFRWIHYINPLAYAFEGLMINEFANRDFLCSNFVPSGEDYMKVSPRNRMCSIVGAALGADTVSGDDYLRFGFGYEKNHVVRNLVALITFMAIFMFAYLVATEKVLAKKCKGEILLFKRRHKPQFRRQKHLEIYSGVDLHKYSADGDPISKIQRQSSIFQWKDICLDVKIGGRECRILDHVDGWIKPGTLTALMGPSGARKTALLNVLSSRSNVGIVSGETYLDGCLRDRSFQRKVGFIQQQDFHLATTTVREALQFSALLRQSPKIVKKEKFAYVEEIIKLLDMEVYADAVVGRPGEGLNIEQRKRLTIGVELVSKPKLLLFFDDVTSELDSVTSWAILELLQKLAAHGQAIICAVSQPPASFLERFDRVLILGFGGKPVYFGEVGRSCETVRKYFQENGAASCPRDGDVAGWIIQLIGYNTSLGPSVVWPEVWRKSAEFIRVQQRLESMRKSLRARSSFFLTGRQKPSSCKEFASPFTFQMCQCFRRTSTMYWRTPVYVFMRLGLSVFYALFLGFSFYRDLNDLEDLQNQMFGVFMLLTLGLGLVLQIFPNFLMQRDLFEAREEPAKFYSWQAFITSNILAELPWNVLAALLIFLCWYYPTGMYHNATGGSTRVILEKNGLMIVFLFEYLTYASTFGQLMQVGVELAETAAKLSHAVFLVLLMFCGIIIVPTAQPQLWTLIHRLSPFTYLVDGILSVGLAGVTVQCSDLELLHFEPATSSTCGSYMASYIRNVGGYLVNPSATSNCAFCAVKDSKEYIISTTMSYAHRWQNVGILWAYISFNIIMTLFVYWLVRVPKSWRRSPKKHGQRQANLRQEDGVSGSSRSEGSYMKHGRGKENSSRAKNSGNLDDIELAQL